MALFQAAYAVGVCPEGARPDVGRYSDSRKVSEAYCVGHDGPREGPGTVGWYKNGRPIAVAARDGPNLSALRCTPGTKRVSVSIPAMFGPAKSKNEAFLGAFIAHAGQSVEAATLLIEMLEHPDRNERLALDVSEKEATGDRLIHETVKRLHETWITSLDRNDIYALISRLDDVLDFIEAVAERLVLFEIREVRPGSIDMAHLLLKTCEHVQRAMMALPQLSKNSKELLATCVEINRLENETDAIYRREMAALFKAGNDPLLVMKWRDILDNIEEATDRCEDVANIVEGIVLEYA